MTAGKNGPSLTMTSCSRCEHRSWSDGNAWLATPDLLRVISGKQDFALQASARAAAKRAG